jgi:transposase InsO family protein
VTIRSDNGSEFIESNLSEWLDAEGIKTLYIDPGSPWQNGFIESFHARFREEYLNREQFWTLTEVRVVIEDWRYKYNSIPTAPSVTSLPSSSRALLLKLARSLTRRSPSALVLTFYTTSKKH